jgi:hypothetical protein
MQEESEVEMKVRLAKKIIFKQCRYWRDRRIDYGFSLLFPHIEGLKRDHRFMKANIVTKWRYAIGGRHEKKIL